MESLWKNVQSLVIEVLSWPTIFGVIAGEDVNLIQPWSHYVSLDFALIFLHRKRDLLGRFLPCNIQEYIFNPKPEEPPSENEEKPFKNPFTITQEWIPSSSNESLHLNDLFVETECQDNPLSLVIYQPPLPIPPLEMVQPQPQPTFHFPIPP